MGNSCFFNMAIAFVTFVVPQAKANCIIVTKKTISVIKIAEVLLWISIK